MFELLCGPSLGPCALTSISVATECNNDTILVAWENMLSSTLYVVTAEGHDQSLISCNSSSDSCELEDVRCGMRYSIIVSASSNRCSNLRSPPKKIQTGNDLTHWTFTPLHTHEIFFYRNSFNTVPSSPLCTRQCDSGSVMWGEWGDSDVGTLPCGHFLPANSHRKWRTRGQLQHLSEQLHPGWSALRSVVRLEHHSQRRQLHQPAQHLVLQIR